MDDIDREQNQGALTALFVVLAMFAFLCVVVSAVDGAEDADYLRARAAIAIHASQSHSVPVSVESKPETNEKPFLFVYTTTNCQPCETAKRELKAAKDLPFKVVFDRKPNIEIEAYPTFHWTTKSGGWTLEGWYGVKHLESEWRASQSKSKSTVSLKITVSARTLRLKSFAASYRGRTTAVVGMSYRQHLMDSRHGFTNAELSGLTEHELERLHSACHHYGLSAADLRAYAARNGL